MHGEQHAAPEQAERFERVRRTEMNVAPRFVERADLEHHQVEGAEASGDLGIFGGSVGITAEEHRMLRAAYDHRRPERGIARAQTSTEKCCDGAASIASPVRWYVRLFPPIELRNARCRHSQACKCAPLRAK